MSRAALWILTGVAGILCGDLSCHSVALRDKLGLLCRRGHLLALVHGRGIYEADVDRMLHESDYVSDIERSSAAEIERGAALKKLIALAAARSQAGNPAAPKQLTEREFNLIRSQFRDNPAWNAALYGSELSTLSLWRMLKEELRTRQWIEKQIGPELGVSDDDCRRFYDAHSSDFFVSERMHASHIFLAAPPETAPEIVESKWNAIKALSVRVAGGEDFATLAAESSEDEATKFNGGDLGYFSTTRMPPDFIAAVAKLRPGEISPPVQTRLGFHIIRLVEIVPARQQTYEEAKLDVALELANQKRTQAVKKLGVDLGSQAGYLRPL